MKQFNIRKLSDEDAAAIERIRIRHGLKSATAAVLEAIRYTDERLNPKTNQAATPDAYYKPGEVERIIKGMPICEVTGQAHPNGSLICFRCAPSKELTLADE